MYSKELTREMLEQMGIYNVYWDVESEEWWIDRYWYVRKNRTTKVHYRVKITEARCKHKYVPDKVYPKITFSYNGKAVSITLSRFLYAWFKGKVEEGQVIDHIENNPYKNNLSNLQAISIEENIRKRYIDNPDMNFNQYEIINRNKLEKAYEALKEVIKEINNEDK